MAETDHRRLTELLASTQFASPQLEALIGDLARDAAAAQAQLEDAAERPEPPIPDSWQVVVECTSEEDQQAVYTRMREEGYKCRVLTL
jgi:hypothetical protein